MALSSGTRLGPYEITAPLGIGGMGEVYRARDTRLDRTVAVKILGNGLAQAPGFRDRFEQEARTVSSLNHPNICALYDVGNQDGTEFLVMEYLDGETLATRLQRGPMGLQECLKYAIELAGALDAAHPHEIVHRDLKPGNIMLCKSGVKLMDFGLARGCRPRASEATLVATLTQQGTVLGTPQYMAPEQVKGAETDARSDIFAFGATLYEMVTGAKAFPGSNPHSIAAAIIEKHPERIATLRPDAPAALQRIIAICLAKDPDERWQSAHDVKLELQGVLELPASDVAPVRRSRREVVAWALLALTFLIGLSLLFLLLRSRSSDATHSYRASLLPPPGTSFEPYNFALSPDGKRLAFVGIGEDGRNSLWVRALNASLAQQFTGTDGASFPFWGPDNRRIGFFAENHLKTLDTSSGAVNVLCEAQTGRGGTWNRRGTIVFAPYIDGPLLSVPESGGDTKQATPIDPQSGKAHWWPWFLPDDDHFLYVQGSGSKQASNVNGLYLGSLKTAQSKLLSPDVSGNVSFILGNIIFVQGRSLMAQALDPGLRKLTGTPSTIFNRELDAPNGFERVGVSISENGVAVFQSISDAASELVWVARDGKELGRIPESGVDPHLSPDGQSVALSSDVAGNGTSVIRVIDLKRGIAAQLTDGGFEAAPVWSPDGSQIAYGPLALYERPADGSGKPERLLQGSRLIPNDYTPDGRYLAYMTNEKGRPYLAFYDRSQRKTFVMGTAPRRSFLPTANGWLTLSTQLTQICSCNRFPAMDREFKSLRAEGRSRAGALMAKRYFLSLPIGN
jgi:serine/threonine protein kinase